MIKGNKKGQRTAGSIINTGKAMKVPKTGTIKWFDIKKGYGFVTDEDGEDYFVHFSDIAIGKQYIGFDGGEKVTFTAFKGKQGIQAGTVALSQDELIDGPDSNEVNEGTEYIPNTTEEEVTEEVVEEETPVEENTEESSEENFQGCIYRGFLIPQGDTVKIDEDGFVIVESSDENPIYLSLPISGESLDDVPDTDSAIYDSAVDIIDQYYAEAINGKSLDDFNYKGFTFDTKESMLLNAGSIIVKSDDARINTGVSIEDVPNLDDVVTVEKLTRNAKTIIDSFLTHQSNN